MKKNIMIINADFEVAQIVKDNLACPSTNILCVSSMHEALLSFTVKPASRPNVTGRPATPPIPLTASLISWCARSLNG